VGLGSADHIDKLTVTWPSGRKQEFRNLAGDKWWRFTEGRDQPEQITPGPAKK
jgi:hypothetical protein